MSEPFTPKQVPPFDADWYNRIGGKATQDVADFLFTQLPPLEADAYVHDNACGMGPVAIAAYQTCPEAAKASLKIAMTDVAPPMIMLAKQAIEGMKLPATAEIMDATKLAFPDETFTHSVLAFGLPIMPDPKAASSEIRRVIKPGGWAVSAFWHSNPGGESLTKVHDALRPASRKMQIRPMEGSSDPEFLKELLSLGGFKKEDIKVSFVSCHQIVPDIKLYAESLWGFVGQPTSGWIQEDEDRWDETIEMCVKELKAHKGVKDLGDGTYDFESIGMVAITQK